VIPATPVGVGALLLAIAPGYLTIYFWSRNKTWKGLTNDLHTVIQGVVVSAVIQVLIAPITIWQLYPVRDHLDLHPVRVAAWSALALLVVPYLLGTVAARVSDRAFPAGSGALESRKSKALATVIQPSAEPSIWDWAVPGGKLNGKYVIVEFDDGKVVGGTFSLGSMALTSPQRQGIFLNREWVIDEAYNFVAPVPNSDGIMIDDMSSVRSVRVLRGQP
jgi:putative flippase GtrA